MSAKDTRSFFERITGAVRMDDRPRDTRPSRHIMPETENEDEVVPINDDQDDSDGELSVDVFQNSDQIIIKTMVAGVRPEDLDINITRDTVTVRGKREEERSITRGDYFMKELYWGTFSRTIALPEEVDVDGAEAVEKHGLLILKLPKLDKKKQTKLRVKTI